MTGGRYVLSSRSAIVVDGKSGIAVVIESVFSVVLNSIN